LSRAAFAALVAASWLSPVALPVVVGLERHHAEAQVDAPAAARGAQVPARPRPFSCTGVIERIQHNRNQTSRFHFWVRLFWNQGISIT